jgi:hypothetical protein
LNDEPSPPSLIERRCRPRRGGVTEHPTTSSPPPSSVPSRVPAARRAPPRGWPTGSPSAWAPTRGRRLPPRSLRHADRPRRARCRARRRRARGRPGRGAAGGAPPGRGDRAVHVPLARRRAGLGRGPDHVRLPGRHRCTHRRPVPAGSVGPEPRPGPGTRAPGPARRAPRRHRLQAASCQGAGAGGGRRRGRRAGPAGSVTCPGGPASCWLVGVGGAWPSGLAPAGAAGLGAGPRRATWRSRSAPVPPSSPSRPPRGGLVLAVGARRPRLRPVDRWAGPVPPSVAPATCAHRLVAASYLGRRRRAVRLARMWSRRRRRLCQLVTGRPSSLDRSPATLCRCPPSCRPVARSRAVRARGRRPFEGRWRGSGAGRSWRRPTGRSLASLEGTPTPPAVAGRGDGLDGIGAGVVIAVGSTKGVHRRSARSCPTTWPRRSSCSRLPTRPPPGAVAVHRAGSAARYPQPPLPGDPDRALTAVLDARGNGHRRAAGRGDLPGRRRRGHGRRRLGPCGGAAPRRARGDRATNRRRRAGLFLERPPRRTMSTA